MAYGDFKHLTRRIGADKVLCVWPFSIAKNSKDDGYKCRLASMVYKLFDKKTSGGAATIAQWGTLARWNKSAVKNENMPNNESAEELHKPTVKKVKKRKVHTPFTDNSWSVDLTDIQLISELNKGIRFLLHVIDIFRKETWVTLLKDKKSITITNYFQKICKKSNRKPNKILVDNLGSENIGSEFYNRLMKSWLEKSETEIYSKHNE